MFAKFCVLCALAIPATAYFYIGSQSPNSIYTTATRSPNPFYFTRTRSPNHIFYTKTLPPASVSKTRAPNPIQSSGTRSPNSIFTTTYRSNYVTYKKSRDPDPRDIYPLNNVEIQKKIEQYHNEFRSQVSPPASNMLYMHWNQEAAIQAQKYAEVCRFVEHNSWKERKMKSYGSCGQNLFGSQVKMDWYQAIESWFSEHVNFTYGSPHNVFPDIGHYTSMVWATSHQVGCGVAFCKGGPWGQFYNYVCHYCPSGNYDYYPYKIGQSCGDCPYDCVWGSLCTNSCPSLDTLGNCEELLVEPDICNSGECNATCWCRDKIYKNYPWV